MMKKLYKFSAAQEGEFTVFGASRPGYSNKEVRDWIQFMKNQDIKKICCLLSESQLNRYSNLLDTYQDKFGMTNICWTPIEDFHLADVDNLRKKILPFLTAADKQGDKVVVHCSGGIGRTGQVLAAWLVSGRGLSNPAAIASVIKAGRNPYEFAIAAIIKGKNPLKAMRELDELLDSCRLANL